MVVLTWCVVFCTAVGEREGHEARIEASRRVPARLVSLGAMVDHRDRDLALSAAAAVATVVFVGEMMRAVRHRDEPRTLARLSGTFEGHVTSLLANSAGLVSAYT